MRTGWIRRLRQALASARTEEKVRGAIAVVLVGVLLALLFKTPTAAGANDAAVASAKTLCIAVIAFYFGLHGMTPQGQTPAERENDATRVPPNPPA
jgi:hypothetical protein